MLDTRTGMERWMRIICAVALVCIGLAHKPALAGLPSAFALDLAQYAFRDGSLPVHCRSGDEGGIGKKGGICLPDFGFVAPVPGVAAAGPMPAGVTTPPRAEIAACGLFPANASPRGPPSPTAA